MTEYYETNLSAEEKKGKAGAWLSSANGDQGWTASFGAAAKKRKSRIKRLGLFPSWEGVGDISDYNFQFPMTNFQSISND